jgi:hypothetical protein
MRPGAARSALLQSGLETEHRPLRNGAGDSVGGGGSVAVARLSRGWFCGDRWGVCAHVRACDRSGAWSSHCTRGGRIAPRSTRRICFARWRPVRRHCAARIPDQQRASDQPHWPELGQSRNLTHCPSPTQAARSENGDACANASGRPATAPIWNSIHVHPRQTRHPPD